MMRRRTSNPHANEHLRRDACLIAANKHLHQSNEGLRRSWTKLMRKHLPWMGALVCLGSLLLAGGVSAKPATPMQPSWRLQNAASPPVKGPPRKKRTDVQSEEQQDSDPAAGWEASAVPLPERKPAELNGPSSIVEKAPAGTKQTQPGPPDVITTEVIGDEEKTAQPEPFTSGDGPANKQYCSNIANAAADARFVWQKKALLQTEQEVAKRVEELNAKIAEYQKWLARRDEFSRKAETTVVNIYAKMKPDAAAQQLTVLDEEMAAAVLAKLDPRAASAVMNEMDPKHAARLTSIITGASKGPGIKLPGAMPASKDKGT